MPENVLCVKAEALSRIWPGEVCDAWSPRVGSLPHLIRLTSLPPDMFACGVRPDVETDESIKQLVTYVSVICGDDILTYRRGSKGDEGRLHAKRSVGIGGHVKNPGYVTSDLSLLFRISQEARREIEEELYIDIGDSVAFVPTGLIYDPSDPVGRVHLGITFVIYLSSKDGIGANCPSIEDVWWEPIDRLRRAPDSYESWSVLLLDYSLF